MVITTTNATPGYLMSGGIGASRLAAHAGQESAWRQAGSVVTTEFPITAVKRPSVDVPTGKVPPLPPERCP
jgi:hypothetical protein